MKFNIETYLRIKPYIPENNTNDTIITQKPENPLINYQIDKNQKNKIYISSSYSPDPKNNNYLNNKKNFYEFKFNEIFESNTSQQKISEILVPKIINNAIDGYNSTIFCYGQTGTGKTYTMCGKNNDPQNPNSGIIPRLINSLFKKIEKEKNILYNIYISFIEIYNENAYDLFDKNNYNSPLEKWKKISVYEDNYGNSILKNMSMIKVENEQQSLDLLQTGNSIRHESSTISNLASSRSHAIFSLIIEGINDEITKVAKINMVDLAGSERIKANNKKDLIINETKHINLSLSFLEQVIIALSEKDKNKSKHIPYRNCLMTTILKDSLGGNCKTFLIANISSEFKYLDESLSTMRFALRCSKIKNEVSINKHIDLNVLVNQLSTENNCLIKKIEELEKIVFKKEECLPFLNREFTEFDKDECKILINNYLNDNSKNKKLNASNVNQLLYIIDFLIEYIDNKEKKYKIKMENIIKENNELVNLAKCEDDKFKKINNIIHKNNLQKYFMEICENDGQKYFNKEDDNFTNNGQNNKIIGNNFVYQRNKSFFNKGSNLSKNNKIMDINNNANAKKIEHIDIYYGENNKIIQNKNFQNTNVYINKNKISRSNSNSSLK